MSVKIVKFAAAAMKAVKNPQLLGTLETFHKSLIIHLMYLDAQVEDELADDFQIKFRKSAREYLDFLKTMGAELPDPVNAEKTAAGK